jgi:uncharacterized protein
LTVLARQAPVAESERIVALDVLRGVAVLGILFMNIGAFAMPAATYFDPTTYGDLSGLNGWVWRLTHVFADLKFMAIFSMLFGAGIVLMAERSAAQGRSAAGLHYRRMGWLIAFGLLHAHLLWYGDILYWYGVCGLVVYFFRRVRPGWLIGWGVLLLGVASGLMLMGGLTMPTWPEATVQQVMARLAPTPEMTGAEIAMYQGGWLEQMEARVPKALEMQTSTLFSWAAWRVSGLMLLGMALFKLGVFSAKHSPRFYGALLAIGAIVGVPVIVYGITQNVAAGWDVTYFFWFGLQFNYWASLLVALGWIGLIMLACRASLLGITRPLAAVGRMAFSNYILQTLVCTTIFYGHGLGLFGQLERTPQLLIVIAVCALQLTISPLWLRHFRFGPLEWVWRSLVYLQRQPFRRHEVAAGSVG